MPASASFLAAATLAVGKLGAFLPELAEKTGLGARPVAVLFDLLLGFGRIAGERNGEEPLLADGLGGNLADTVGAVMDALDRGLDFRKRLLLIRHHAEGEIAVKGVGAGISHVLAIAGKVTRILLGRALEGFLGMLVELPEEMTAQ